MRILFLGLVWPEPTSSAAGWRILHLIKLFRTLGEVFFVSAATKTIYSADLKSLGVHESVTQLNDSSFDEYIKNLNPDVVIFDRFMVEEQYGWRVAEQCPDALRILDTEDLHFVRQARQEAFKKNQEIDYYSSTAKRELAAIWRSDISLIISDSEMTLLKDVFNIPQEKIFYLPFQEDKLTQHAIELLPTLTNRQDFVFIGNFNHEPNWRTVEILKKDVWPILRMKCPKAQLHIYGSYPSQKVFQLQNVQEKFIIKGRAESARDTLANYRVLVAPIPFGAGAKGKFVDAMAVGLPSVTTSIGAESMIKSEWNGYIEDNMTQFIDRCAQLYMQDELWLDKQQLGFSLFNTYFADDSYSIRFIQRIKEDLPQLAHLRRKNFIGEILQHQQLHATKYMSMWIEEKNKKHTNIN